MAIEDGCDNAHLDDYWNFIHDNLPDYYSDDDVSLSNYVSAMLDNPADVSNECKRAVAEYIPDFETKGLIALQADVDSRLLRAAIINHLSKKHKLI